MSLKGSSRRCSSCNKSQSTTLKLQNTSILSIYGFRDGENPDGIAESSHINGIYCITRSHGICQSLDELIKSRSVHLTLWLCSDSCHSRCVPGQKWPDSKQLLINLSLCYIFTKYWIQSFCQLVFFHLGLVLCFYLHLINRRPHLSESRHLIYWVKKAFFMNNFHNIKQKIIKICTVSHTSVL